MEILKCIFSRMIGCCFIFSINIFYMFQKETLPEAIRKTNKFVLINGDFFNDYGIFISGLLCMLFLTSFLFKSFLSISFAKLAQGIDTIVSIIINRLKNFLSVLSSVCIVNLVYLLMGLVGIIKFNIDHKQMNVYLVLFIRAVCFFEYTNYLLMKYKPMTRLDTYNIRSLRFFKW